MLIFDLPVELLSRICQYLDKPTLRACTLIDKHCRSVAGPLLFRAISIYAQQATEFGQFLQHTAYHKHIRVLEINGGLRATLHADSGPFPHPDLLSKHPHPKNCVPWRKFQDIPWQPIVELLETLPALTDLIWNSPHQLPPCILRTLHDRKQLVSCRLHLRTFRPKSTAVAEAAFDPYELALIQSPSLSSIWCHFDSDNTFSHKLHFPEATFRTICRLAPNLRSIRLWEEAAMAELNPGHHHSTRLRLLEDLTSSHPQTLGQLSELQFAGESILSAEGLAKWRLQTDFAVLKNVILDCEIEPSAMSYLAGCSFTNLTTVALQLSIELDYLGYQAPRPDEMSAPTRDFLCNIPPLMALKLSGEMDHSYLRHVIAHHGQTLQKLWILPYGYSPARLSLPPTEVSWIGSHCSVLESLRLTMLRSRGDAVEVAAYISLGRVPSLQTVDLTLDASDYSSLREDVQGQVDYEQDLSIAQPLALPKLHSDDFDRESSGTDCAAHLAPRKGHLKDMFINSALDQTLAESIYSKLNSAKPPGALAFDRIELRSVGGGDFGMGVIIPSLRVVAKEIQRRWLIQKDENPAACPQAFAIRELKDGKQPSTSNDWVNANVMEILRRLWPAKADGRGWRDDWHSFPLFEDA